LIRRATLSDIDGLVDLWISMQCHMEESNCWIWRITEEGKRLIRERAGQALMGKDSCVVVAERKAKLIGLIYGQVLRRSDYLPEKVGMISSIYVAEGFRKRGVGRRLVEELCQFFSGEGVEQVTLRYVVGNVEGERFWTRLGFEAVIITASTYLGQLKKRVKP
jgi:GNAT superfamily N-acetyltransferase